MGALLILETFTGYPDGEKRLFLAGEVVDPDEIPTDFADLIIKKGHAKRAETTETENAEAVEREDRPARRRRGVGQ